MANVKGALRMSFKACIFELLLSLIDVFELADLLSLKLPGFYALLSMFEITELVCSSTAITLLSVL